MTQSRKVKSRVDSRRGMNNSASHVGSALEKKREGSRREPTVASSKLAPCETHIPNEAALQQARETNSDMNDVKEFKLKFVLTLALRM